MLQHMLIGLDGSPLAEAILPVAGTLAKRLGAQVTLLQVLHLPDDVRDTASPQQLQQLQNEAANTAKDYLLLTSERLSDADHPVRTAVSVGDAAAEIVAFAQQGGADLIALATHGRTGLQRWVYGSVAEKVLHISPVPVLLLRPDEQAAPHAELQQLLVPLDGSGLAEAVLPLVESLALRLQAPVTLLRVVELPTYAFGDPTVGLATDAEYYINSLTETATAYLDGIAAGLRSAGITVVAATPFGFPATEITRHAQQVPGSLVVMASHGRSGLSEMLMGSVAREALRSSAPILIMPKSALHLSAQPAVDESAEAAGAARRPAGDAQAIPGVLEL
ncbi:MAG: universal stress protein [Chloroflexi bacterium]|nr:universal stress protein [Chloroflexota bacterium]